MVYLSLFYAKNNITNTMITISQLNSQITSITEIYDQYIEYIDSVDFTDSSSKTFVVSENIISSTNKCAYSSIQYLEELKNDSLTEYIYKTIEETTVYNVCFLLYKNISEENITSLIISNDLNAFDNTEIDPNMIIIPKGFQLKYYK